MLFLQEKTSQEVHNAFILTIFHSLNQILKVKKLRNFTPNPSSIKVCILFSKCSFPIFTHMCIHLFFLPCNQDIYNLCLDGFLFIIWTHT